MSSATAGGGKICFHFVLPNSSFNLCVRRPGVGCIVWLDGGRCEQRRRWANRARRVYAAATDINAGPSHGVLSDSVFTRSSIAIQFTSHVLPPSFENDCSKRQ